MIPPRAARFRVSFKSGTAGASDRAGTDPGRVTGPGG